MNFLKKIFPLSFNMTKDTKSFVWGIILNAAIWMIAPIIVVVPLILAGAFMSTGVIALAIFLMDTVLDMEKRVRAHILKKR